MNNNRISPRFVRVVPDRRRRCGSVGGERPTEDQRWGGAAIAAFVLAVLGGVAVLVLVGAIVVLAAKEDARRQDEWQRWGDDIMRDFRELRRGR